MVRPEKASPTLLGGDGEEIIVIPGPADLACERRQPSIGCAEEIQTANSTPAAGREEKVSSAVPSPSIGAPGSEATRG